MRTELVSRKGNSKNNKNGDHENMVRPVLIYR